MKIALVGYGRWGKVLARSLSDIESPVEAIVDPVSDRLTEAQNEHPYASVYEDLATCLADLDIDAVVISSSASTHYDLSVMALYADKHVFVEKPMALNLEHARDMAELAESRHRVLFVGHLFRYHPGIVKLCEIVRTGYLGDVEYISSSQLAPGRVRTEEDVVHSFAPHDVSIVLELMSGEVPKIVRATTDTLSGQQRSGLARIDMWFARCHAEVNVSWASPWKQRKVFVLGTRRMAMFDDVAKKLFTYEGGGGSEVFFSNRQGLPVECELRTFMSMVKDGLFFTDRLDLSVMDVLERAARSQNVGDGLRLTGREDK